MLSFCITWVVQNSMQMDVEFLYGICSVVYPEHNSILSTVETAWNFLTIIQYHILQVLHRVTFMGCWWWNPLGTTWILLSPPKPVPRFELESPPGYSNIFVHTYFSLLLQAAERSQDPYCPVSDCALLPVLSVKAVQLCQQTQVFEHLHAVGVFTCQSELKRKRVAKQFQTLAFFVSMPEVKNNLLTLCAWLNCVGNCLEYSSVVVLVH